MKGWWRLNTYDIELTDADIEHICKLIKNGFFEGEIIHEENNYFEENIERCD